MAKNDSTSEMSNKSSDTVNVLSSNPSRGGNQGALYKVQIDAVPGVRFSCSDRVNLISCTLKLGCQGES